MKDQGFAEKKIKEKNKQIHQPNFWKFIVYIHKINVVTTVKKIEKGDEESWRIFAFLERGHG